jgi:hypothetical protein
VNIKSIEREAIADTDLLITTVVVSEVTSPCILARVMIDAFGRPGVDNDMELVGSGNQWVISWTQPNLTLDETTELVTKAIRN